MSKTFSFFFSFFFFFLPLLLLFKTSFAGCNYKFIHNANELVQFSAETNSGTTYSGYTVYLVADISFTQALSQQFVPITNFLGTFDGQGYAIKNLALSTSSTKMVGLFGTSNGLVIQNVVIDKSSSITSNSQNYDAVNIAGFIACCGPNSGPCIIQNSVNMANVAFTGSTSVHIYIAGFVAGAYVTNSDRETKIVNCANYGTISHSGHCNNNAYVGGIVGEICATVETYKSYVYNSINYGQVSVSGTSGYYYIGGITGCSFGSTTENTVSAGVIYANHGGFVGSILGESITYPSTISHSYWSTSISCGYCGTTDQDIRGSEPEQITLSSSYLSGLNSYSSGKKWGGWAYNTYGSDIKFYTIGSSYVSYSTQFIVIPEPSRRGYSFLFWCVNQNSLSGCSNKKYTHSAITFNTGASLYAQWVANSCTVYFNLNGGDSISSGSINIKYDQKYGTSFPTAKKEGHSLTGWFTASSGGTKITSESLVNDQCNCSTLYAQWKINQHTITFNSNGGSAVASVTKNYGTVIQLSTPTKGGYKFMYWSNKYGHKYTGSFTIKEDDTFNAHWEAENYVVTLDENGGDKLPDESRTVTVPSNKVFDNLPVPTRMGYMSIGWLTEDKKMITNESTFVITKSQTLIAQWAANKYNVGFDVSGDEIVREETVTFDSPYGDLFTPGRVGYQFINWLNEDNDTVINTTIVKIARNHVLHAGWAAENYTITFNSTGGDLLETTMNVTYEDIYDELPEPTKDGYDFGGWFTEENGGGEEIVQGAVITIIEDVMVYATWVASTYPVFFDVNGGDELSEDNREKEVTYNDIYDTLPVPTRIGYTFDGWFSESGEEIKNDTIVEILGNQTLFAWWTASNYTMALDVNGGVEFVESEKNITVTYNSTYGFIPTPSREGYTFSGWFTKDDKEVTSESIVTDACNCTLYANWIANKYTVYLDVNGGVEFVESEKNITVTFNSTYGFIPTPKRTGYTFDGWFTKDDKEVTSGSIVTYACNYTLYANWTVNKYTVYLDINGGDEFGGDKRNITVTYNSTYGFIPVPSREGYEFIGWFTKDDVEITEDTTVDILMDQTLYAHWSKITITSQIVPSHESSSSTTTTTTTESSNQAGTPSRYVEIVFGKNDLSEEEIISIIKKFTNANFDIIKIEPKKSGETVVIIRFDNIEDAEKFLAAFEESDDSAKIFVRRAGFNSRADTSLSSFVCPFMLSAILLFY